MKIKNWKEKLEQIEPSKANGGRIYNIPKEGWDNFNNWVAEKKLDGTRLLMHITSEGQRFTTRRISGKTNKYMERSNNFPHFRDLELDSLEGTVLDGEGFAPTHSWNDTASIIGSSPEKSWERQKEFGKLEYWIFDIIKYKGKDVREFSYRERHVMMMDIIKQIKKKYPETPLYNSPWIHRDKLRFYKRMVNEGQEGIMMKNLNSQYGERKGMLKVKRFERFTMIVTGFKKGNGKYEGAVGSIGVGFYGEKQLTYASGLSDKQRWEAAKEPDKWLGKIVEVECEQMTSTGNLRHPRFIGFRIDKKKEDCKRIQNKEVA